MKVRPALVAVVALAAIQACGGTSSPRPSSSPLLEGPYPGGVTASGPLEGPIYGHLPGEARPPTGVASGPLEGPVAGTLPGGPSPTPTPDLPSNVRIMKLVAIDLRRDGKAVPVSELTARGWETIDLLNGYARYEEAGIGIEQVRWTVPFDTYAVETDPQRPASRPDPLRFWAAATAARGVTLAHEPYLTLVGMEQDGGVQLKTFAADGGSDEKEATVLLAGRRTARPGDRAEVQVHLGYHAMGYLVVYAYEYRP